MRGLEADTKVPLAGIHRLSRGRAVYQVLLPLLVIALVGVVAVRELRIRDLKQECAQAATALEDQAAETAWWKRATEAALPAFSHLMAVKDVEGPTLGDLDLADEDAEFLNTTLASIFPHGREELSAEHQCLEIMRYVSAKMTRKPNDGSGSKALKDGYGMCGNMTDAFTALCRSAALPTRKVGLHNLPGMDFHAVAEVYFSGDWHFFDPTFGVFFYSQVRYAGDGTIVSLRELLSAPNSWSMLRVVHRPWLGRYDDAIRGMLIEPVDDYYLRDISGLDGVSFHDLYRADLRVGFPVVVPSDAPFSYPMTADLGGATSVQLGRIDGSADDLFEHGHLQLGRFGFHTWTIQGAAGSKVAVEYVFQHSDAPELIVVPLKGARAVQTDGRDNRAAIGMHLSDDQAIIVVFATRDAPLDAIEIQKVAAAPGT